jgi:hypothetical protein
MRSASLIPALMLLALPTIAYPDPPTTNPSPATEYNEANWADWDAQARIAEGDYDGAIQAEQQAKATRKQADELATRSTKRPAASPP